jgi:hypothetical protein
LTRYYTNQWINELKGRVPPHKDKEISDERNKCLKRYFPDIEERKKVHAEFGIFSGQINFDVDSMEERWTLDPLLWWLVHGSSLPILQTLAIKLLGQPCSSSCAERNWKTYAFVHSLKRNKITPKRAEDLVFVHCNLRLLSRRRDEYNKGKTQKWDIGGDSWDEPFGGGGPGLLEIANLSLDEPEMELRLVEIDGEDNGEEDDVM